MENTPTENNSGTASPVQSKGVLAAFRQNLALFASVVGIVSALIAAVMLYNTISALRDEIIALRTANIALQNDNLRLRDELQKMQRTNGDMYSLLVLLFGRGNVTFNDLRNYLPAADAQRIAHAATPRATIPFEIGTYYAPSGWMGDGEYGERYLSFRREAASLDGRQVVAVRIEYRQGPRGFAGIYWQHPDGNWGTQPGQNITGARTITFYARGERGGELVEFKSGGISGKQFQDTYTRSTGVVQLATGWRQFTIDLPETGLESVIGAFCWVAAASDNRGHVVLYLADIKVE